jgi:hypothetical protein
MYSLRKQYSKGTAMNLIAKLLMNSLYGKFGMKTEMTKVEVINNNPEILNKYLDKIGTNIVDIIHSDDKIILIYTLNKLSFKEADNHLEHDAVFHTLDVNIAIASAISAYARIKMSYFKNNPEFNLYNSDTDNIVIDKELPAHLVGNELGQLKLEHKITKAVFLAPKVYGIIEETGNEIIKAKGLVKNVIKTINITDLERLLVKDSVKLLKQDKTQKSLFKSNISMLNTAFTLKQLKTKENYFMKTVY